LDGAGPRVSTGRAAERDPSAFDDAKRAWRNIQRHVIIEGEEDTPKTVDCMAVPSPPPSLSQVAEDLASLAFVSEGLRGPLNQVVDGPRGQQALNQINAQLNRSEDDVSAVVDRLRRARDIVVAPSLGLQTALDLDQVIFQKVGPGAIRDKLRELATSSKPERDKAHELIAELDRFHQFLVTVHTSIRPKQISAETVQQAHADLSPLSQPLGILREAIQAVPSVKYALGVAGIAAAAAIVTTLLGGQSRLAIISISFVVVGMFVLFLFSSLITSGSSAAKSAGITLMWATTIFVIIFMVFTTTVVASGYPCNWAEFLALRSACQTPPPDDRKCSGDMTFDERVKCEQHQR
jgi:hypothetical protein